MNASRIRRSRPFLSPRPARVWMLLGAGGLAVSLFGACASPITYRDDDDLQRSIEASAARELAPSGNSTAEIELEREIRTSQLRLSPETLEELDRISGPDSYRDAPLPMPPPLIEGNQALTAITLERAMRTAVEHNLNIEFARLAPAVSEAELVAAQAVFDWVLFSNLTYSKIDQPRTSTGSLGFSSFGSTEQSTVEAEVGVRKRLASNGQLTLASEWGYADDETEGLGVAPDPARTTNLLIRLDQPLLRNFGSDVALAQVRLAQNTVRDDIQDVKAQLLDLTLQVEQAYWTLYQAHANVKILERLFQRAVIARDTLQNRDFDVTPAEQADAAARAEQRRGDLIDAQRLLVQASNQLKLVMNDPELSIGTNVLLAPVDVPIAEPVRFSLLDSLEVALARRPEIARALISIDNTSIRRKVADNARLPQLDLQASARTQGLDETYGEAYDDIERGNFVDYIVGLAFEQPVGNRAAEATYRARRLQQMQSVIAYRNTVQGVISEVKNALVDLVSDFRLIEQRRVARVAAAEVLRARQVEEETIADLDANFLNLKLRDQEALANAEQQEVNALVSYNVSIARLAAVTGTALQRNRIDFVVPDAEQLAPQSPIFPIWPVPQEWQLDPDAPRPDPDAPIGRPDDTRTP